MYYDVHLDMKIIHNLPKPYSISDCVQQNQVTNYTANDCKLQCQSDYMVKECGCKLPGYPDGENGTNCPIHQIKDLDHCTMKLNYTEAH